MTTTREENNMEHVPSSYQNDYRFRNLPVATTELARGVSHYDTDLEIEIANNTNLATILGSYCGADCWSFITYHDNHPDIHWNSYSTLSEGDGQRMNLLNTEFRYLIESDPDEFHIYMFGEDSWIVKIYKSDTNPRIDGKYDYTIYV